MSLAVLPSQPALEPGNCWPFAGSRGNITVVLRSPIVVTNVTLDHASLLVANKSSAPKKCSVWVRCMLSPPVAVSPLFALFECRASVVSVSVSDSVGRKRCVAAAR
jgi:hypothetical protein